MLCHTVQYGGYMFLILCLLISTANSTVQENTFTIQEFCSGNLYIHNIEPGEPYKLTLKSEPNGVSKWYQKSKRKCRQEFKTSNSAAHFVVQISNMSIPSCDNCRCNYFEISVSGHIKRFCGQSEVDYFSSKSDKLSIEFHHGSTVRFDVSFTFTVQRNVYIITGTPKDSSDSSSFIETPYFPAPYPPNYKAEYILQSTDPQCHVLLLFLDFQISRYSFIEVTGNNGTHPTRFYGDIFRPPVIVSQSYQLTLKFHSNDDYGSLSGFRAISSFIRSTDSLVVPYADCGGSKDGRGGYMNIKTHEGFGLYDCVWHIIPFAPFTKSSITNLSVFTRMKNIGHKSNLEFRSGRNSKSRIIRLINCETDNCNDLDTETILPASDDLYIRFRGYLDVYSIFNISYSTYHTGNCSKKEFRCANGRCLLSDFRCDGIRHCSNGSDEELCPAAKIYEEEKTSVPSVQSKVFHSDDVYKKFFVIVVLGIFGLATVVVSISIFIYNYCKSIMTAEPILPQRTSGELSDVQPTLYPVNPCDDLPSYEDFIKSSECYPPLLFTRAKQHFNPKDTCNQCTTSFCTNPRMRYHSADSFSVRNSDTDSGDIFLNISDVPHSSHFQSPNRYNVEINQNNSFKAKSTVRKSYSLDSKLNDLINQDSCYFTLSIIHPLCTHVSNHRHHFQWHTLPTNFKMSAFNGSSSARQKLYEPSLLELDSNVNFSKDRRFTWSFIPCNSLGSDLVTVVKTRCFSEPYRGISVHYSLY